MNNKNIKKFRNTKVSYLYRDGSNYKKANEVVVKGRMTQSMAGRIYSSCDGEYFIPEQIGLPAERFDTITEDDTCFCEFDMRMEHDFIPTDEEPTVSMTTDELVRSFELASSQGWDCAKYALFPDVI